MPGGEEADGTGVQLRGEDAEIDQALAALYDSVHPVVLGGSKPQIAPEPQPIPDGGLIVRWQRLHGLINEYSRAA